MQNPTNLKRQEFEERITRRAFNRMAAGAGVCFLAPIDMSASSPSSAAFVHPGILHTSADLERMRRGVRQKLSPIIEGFEKLRAHEFSRFDYVPSSFGEEIGRNPSVNFPDFDRDSNAAYQCALMAAVTGDSRYSSTARKIVSGWSVSLQRVTGADAVLMAGLGPFKLINAAEILRALGHFEKEQLAQISAMLRRAILPAIADFALFANGNWDTAAVKTMLAIAVFCDDRGLFERALQYYLHGDGDGQLTNYIYENGQCQESGRDQQHTQLGLAHMGDACEIAWHQGLDLYGAMGNRLLRGFEYTAGYNLGGAVEFNPDVDRTGKYWHKVISPRGALRPVYEQIFAHYNGRRGLETPNVARAVQQLRPEGAAQGADHTGFGTLLYALGHSASRAEDVRTAPAALHAEAKDDGVELSWLAQCTAGKVLIERAEGEGPFHRIKKVAGIAHFRDGSVRTRQKYQYRLIAGDSVAAPVSVGTSVFTGIPEGWRGAALGESSLAGGVQFDGSLLTIRSAGSGLIAAEDDGYFVAVPSHHTSLSVRFVPQTASQFVQFGLAFRDGFVAKSASVALLVLPQAGDLERHGWHVRLSMRGRDGNSKTISDILLNAPIITYGRLMQPVWLRMQHVNASIVASFSINGTNWQPAGESEDVQDGQLGIAAASGIADVVTAVRFDSIAGS